MRLSLRVCLVLAACAACWGASAGQWYKGNLHMHSFWSDGNVVPEQAVAWYRDHGYHFVCLSDHQLVQTDTNVWREAGTKKFSTEVADAYLSAYAATAQSKTEGGKRFVRLQTVGELKRVFDKEGAFLMIPGLEVNRVVAGRQVHMNGINVHETIPYRYGDTPLETFTRIEAAVRAWGDEHGQKTLFMLNHPTWPYFDITPDVLIALPHVRFFELCNADGGPTFAPHPEWYTIEKFWDVVNAFRIEDGHDPVFGTGTDDTHNYTEPGASAAPGGAWVCVNAERLETDALLRAMYRGDFYASTGVALESVAFDEASGRLDVRVKPEEGVTYTVRFVTTKAGFDRTVATFDDPAAGKRAARTGVRYAEAIGTVAATVEGHTATYELAPDDLYVRATVVSSRRPGFSGNNTPAFETAWTQPYGWRAWQRRNPVAARLTPKK